MYFDENGKNAREDDWLASCHDDLSDDGVTRITCAVALEIASDTMHRLAGSDVDAKRWSEHDIRIALGVISAIRAQRGCEHLESNCEYLTHVMDVVIYG